MKCEKFEQRLDQLWDDRQTIQTDEQLQLHVAQCAECQQILSAAVAVQDGLDAAEFPPMSKNFSGEVVGRTLAIVEKERISARRFNVISLVGIVAALAFVAVVPFLQTPVDDSSSSPSQAVAANEDNGETTKLPGDETADHERTNEVEDENIAAAFPASFTIPEIEVSRLAEVSGQIDSDKIPGVRPITSSFSTAIDLMRSALPGQKSPETEKPQARTQKTSVSHIS